MYVQAPSNLFVEVLLGFLPVADMQGQGSGGWGGGSWGVGWQGPAQGGKGGPQVAVITHGLMLCCEGLPCSVIGGMQSKQCL